MSALDRRPIFQAVRALRKGQGFTLAEVRQLDAAIDAAVADHPLTTTAVVSHETPTGVTQSRQVSQRGISLLQSREKCELKAYPDPGSKNGKPVTIGWGSTSTPDGSPIVLGTVWTQQQCDDRFKADLAKFAADVDRLIGDAPTTQNQFDAMVCLAYNIGIGSTNPAKPGGFTRSSVLRHHKAGDYLTAARDFLMWNKNDGQVMRGLTRRRLAESELYSEGK